MPDMDEIIPVVTTTIEGMEKLTCDARALHGFLEVGRDFSTWIRERIAKYGFMECVDFIRFPNSGESNPNDHRTMDYALSLDMAKELAMVENNERGRQIRRYFIACERRAREVSAKEKPTLRQQAEMFLQQTIEMERQAKRIDDVEAVAVAALAKAESNFGRYTVLGYARLQGMRLDIQEAAKHGKRLTEICRDLGITIEQVRDPRFGLVNTYPEEVLTGYFTTAAAVTPQG